jgi:transposase
MTKVFTLGKKLPKNTKPPRPPSPPPPIAMPRGKELSPYMRTKICEARACGLTPKEIAFQHSVNVDTVRYTLKKERARLENALRPQSGRPRKIDEQTRDYLVNIAFHESPRIQWRSLTRIAAEEIGEDVHKRSVQRLFA